MENEPMSNSEFFEMSKNGKVTASEEKVKWLFIRNYTFIGLTFFTIYRLTFGIIDSKYMKMFNYFQNTTPTIEAFMENMTNQFYIILTISILVILSNFLVVILSSILIFSKYKIKKTCLKNVTRKIIIMQIIFVGVLSFEFTVAYINEMRTSGVDKWRIGQLVGIDTHNQTQTQDTEYYIINENMNKIYFMSTFKYIVLMLTNIACSILCIRLQKNVLEENSV